LVLPRKPITIGSVSAEPLPLFRPALQEKRPLSPAAAGSSRALAGQDARFEELQSMLERISLRSAAAAQPDQGRRLAGGVEVRRMTDYGACNNRTTT
jgi:hypothetical protein